MAKRKGKIPKALKSVLDGGVFVLVVLIITLVISKYVIYRVQVQNVSMQKTLHAGDILLANRLTYSIRDPERFDVIIFRIKGEKEDFIKRVIGLPGEYIQIKEGVIYINDTPIEDYPAVDAPEYAGDAQDRIYLGEGEYFVLGDNRKESIDSRYAQIGLIRSDQIVAHAVLRYWPLSKWKVL